MLVMLKAEPDVTEVRQQQKTQQYAHTHTHTHRDAPRNPAPNKPSSWKHCYHTASYHTETRDTQPGSVTASLSSLPDFSMT